MTEAYNMDCLDAMRQMPDKAFDLAIVDPPYGGGAGSQFVQIEEAGPTGLAAGTRTMSTASGHDLAASLTSTISAARTGGTWAAKYQMRTGGIFSSDISHWDVAPPLEYFQLGFDFVGFEIDKTYFDLQQQRFARHTAQMSLF